MTGTRGPSPLRPPPYGGMASYQLSPMSPVDNEHHPVFHKDAVAVITGAASGIGRAAAEELAKLGLKVVLADVQESKLNQVGKEIAAFAGEGNVLVIPTDVSKVEEVVRLRDTVYETWGEVSVLMNNAGVGTGADGQKGTSWSGLDAWKTVFDVNLFGIINVQQTFAPNLIHQENASVIINTGSKQGITNPPGNAAYNASKAAVKSLTEGLAHELRSRQPLPNVTAHLFIPGWTHTGLTGDGLVPEKPAGAWSAQETVLYMLDRVRNGDFYVLVPDNETRTAVDHLRIMWGAGDIAEGRPALSRWHPTYSALFEEYIKDGLAQLD